MNDPALFKLLYILVTILPVLPLIACAELNADYDFQRMQMVNVQMKARGIKDPRVLKAFRKVERHLFVPSSSRHLSYRDHPVPIGDGQTISQPFIVAFMTEELELKRHEKVLEIGTGSGYQAAILGELVRKVYSIELIPKLGHQARALLEELGYENIHVKFGDGYKGWPDEAPFHAIIVTCAPEKIPSKLVEQLREGGRMIIPIGPVGGVQKLVRGVKKSGKIEIRNELSVRFVPMVKGKD